MNIPNILTLSRIVMVPILVILYYLPVSWAGYAAAGMFALATATDWFDGYLARKWNQTSAFGAFLDPVADKLIVACVLVVLCGHYASEWIAIPAALIIGREIVISALREWMAELGKRTHVKVSQIGKIKTFMQMISICVLLAATPGSVVAVLGLILLYISAALTLWSMVIYLKAAWPDLTEEL